jgi:hypothetical protein
MQGGNFKNIIEMFAKNLKLSIWHVKVHLQLQKIYECGDVSLSSQLFSCVMRRRERRGIKLIKARAADCGLC